MSRDYKPSPQRSNGSSKGNPFLSGVLVGILLGVGASVGLTIYLKGDDNPFTGQAQSKIEKKEKPAKQKVSEVTVKPNAAEDIQDPNKFDFYTILPETESKITEQQVKDKTTIKSDSYFLQVGAFENEDDADNMKAKLALQGFEAVVQTAEIPNKGIWHRVRVGPLSDAEQINKARGDLVLNGFNADLIKVHTETKTE